MVFYRRAREMHTDGLLGGCEYRRSLWVTNMSLSDATAAYRRANLARRKADHTNRPPPVDLINVLIAWRIVWTKWLANSRV